MKNKLSFEEAKRLSIIKWELYVNHNGYTSNLPTELDELQSNCGLCELHKTKFWHDCDECELSIAGQACYKKDSLYNLWLENRSKQNAKNVLNFIKSLKENS